MATNGSGSSPYWDVGRYTPAGGQDYGNGPIGTELSEQAPDAAYMRYLQGQGIGGGESDFDKWARDQYGRAMTGYRQAMISDPMHTRLNTYLPSLGGYQDWMNRYMATTTPQQRGERASDFSPNVRWINR